MSVVSVIGNVTRDPELRFSSGNIQYARFSIAVNRKKKRGDDLEDVTSFFDVVCFGDMAENVATSLSKGTRVFVTGHLDVTTYDAKDGTKKTQVQITADDCGPCLRYAVATVEKNGRNQMEAF
jgi:single-strand DNA-binding protein